MRNTVAEPDCVAVSCAVPPNGRVVSIVSSAYSILNVMNPVRESDSLLVRCSTSPAVSSLPLIDQFGPIVSGPCPKPWQVPDKGVSA
jgi:hypothetical protein